MLEFSVSYQSDNLHWTQASLYFTLSRLRFVISLKNEEDDDDEIEVYVRDLLLDCSRGNFVTFGILWVWSATVRGLMGAPRK